MASPPAGKVGTQQLPGHGFMPQPQDPPPAPDTRAWLRRGAGPRHGDAAAHERDSRKTSKPPNLPLTPPQTSPAAGRSCQASGGVAACCLEANTRSQRLLL